MKAPPLSTAQRPQQARFLFLPKDRPGTERPSPNPFAAREGECRNHGRKAKGSRDKRQFVPFVPFVLFVLFVPSPLGGRASSRAKSLEFTLQCVLRVEFRIPNARFWPTPASRPAQGARASSGGPGPGPRQRLVLLICDDFVLRPVGSEARTCHLRVTSRHHFRPMFTGHLSPCHYLSPHWVPLLSLALDPCSPCPKRSGPTRTNPNQSALRATRAHLGYYGKCVSAGQSVVLSRCAPFPRFTLTAIDTDGRFSCNTRFLRAG